MDARTPGACHFVAGHAKKKSCTPGVAVYIYVVGMCLHLNGSVHSWLHVWFCINVYGRLPIGARWTVMVANRWFIINHAIITNISGPATFDQGLPLWIVAGPQGRPIFQLILNTGVEYHGSDQILLTFTSIYWRPIHFEFEPFLMLGSVYLGPPALVEIYLDLILKETFEGHFCENSMYNWTYTSSLFLSWCARI